MNSPKSFTLLQASQDHPTLSQLTQLIKLSSQRLIEIQALLPAQLRQVVKAGPIDGNKWCLIIGNNSASAKIRQLLPELSAHLRNKGHNVDEIRLKVQVNPSK